MLNPETDNELTYYPLGPLEDAINQYVDRAVMRIDQQLASTSGMVRLSLGKDICESIQKAFQRPYLGLWEEIEKSISPTSDSDSPRADESVNSLSTLRRYLQSGQNLENVCGESFRNSLADLVKGFMNLTIEVIEERLDENPDMRQVTAMELINKCLEVFSRPGFQLSKLHALVSIVKSADTTNITGRVFAEAVFELFCSFQEKEFDEKLLIRIDPLTNLPDIGEGALINGRLPRPCFEASETLIALDKSKAVDFAFYETDGRACAFAYRFSRIFDFCGTMIWSSLREKYLATTHGEPPTTVAQAILNPSKGVLVTTVAHEDLQFKNFVDKQVSLEGGGSGDVRISWVLIPRKDSIGPSVSNYFPPPLHVNQLAGKHAILLLSCVHSVDKLRDLSALLARFGATSITMICLLNRMGSHAADFAARLRRLDQVPIEFIPVFNLPEFRSEDVRKMQADAVAVFRSFSRRTQVPVYNRLVGQYDKYFQFRDTSSGRFIAGDCTPASEQDVNYLDKTVPIETEEARMLALFSNLILNGDYDSLIGVLTTATDKSLLFPVFAVLLTDLRFLRVTGKARKLYDTISTRLLEHQTARVASTDMDESHMVRAIDNEVHLFLGVALLLAYDAHDQIDVEEWVELALTWNRPISEWRKRPYHALSYLADVRVGWSVLMLLHAGLHNFDDFTKYTRLRADLVAKVKGLLSLVALIEEDSPSVPETEETEVQREWRNLIGRARSALQLLLQDLGEYRTQQKFEVIRFLHAKLITPPQRHNSINTSLTRLSNRISKIKVHPGFVWVC